MSFSRNTILSAVFALSSLAMVAQDAQACPPRGGGFSRGYSSAYSYRRPSYSRYTPAYSQTFSQPVQVVRPVQPVITQPALSQPVVNQPVQQVPVQQVSEGQVIPQQQLQPQTPVQNAAPQPQVPQTQIQQQPLRPVQTAPTGVQQPAAPQTAPAPNSAAMSALQALGGFAPPAGQAPAATEPTPQSAPTPAHVGNWSATLGNGASVRLTLQNDGSFVWVATNQNGNASSFSGRYTVGNGTLTLNRANDNQQLGGTMTISGGNAFSFKVAGNNAAAINFTRS